MKGAFVSLSREGLGGEGGVVLHHAMKYFLKPRLPPPSGDEGREKGKWKDISPSFPIVLVWFRRFFSFRCGGVRLGGEGVGLGW